LKLPILKLIHLSYYFLKDWNLLKLKKD